jgi:hypothetical protein
MFQPKILYITTIIGLPDFFSYSMQSCKYYNSVRF